MKSSMSHLLGPVDLLKIILTLILLREDYFSRGDTRAVFSNFFLRLIFFKETFHRRVRPKLDIGALRQGQVSPLSSSLPTALLTTIVSFVAVHRRRSWTAGVVRTLTYTCLSAEGATRPSHTQNRSSSSD